MRLLKDLRYLRQLTRSAGSPGGTGAGGGACYPPNLARPAAGLTSAEKVVGSRAGNRGQVGTGEGHEYHQPLGMLGLPGCLLSWQARALEPEVSINLERSLSHFRR